MPILEKFQIGSVSKSSARSDGCNTDFMGDIKRLHATEPVYRLRSGDYRVIFEVTGDIVDVLKVKHRREAYD